MKKCLSILLFLSVAYSIAAQAPQQVNYQAVVRDAAGNPLSPGTQVSVKFQVHDQTPAGNVVYQETTTATTNQFGLITYGLGSSGTLSQVNWGNGPKYLQVLIDPTGGSNYTDMGTTQLLSVPYALYAANSGGSAGTTGATGATGAGGNTGPQGPQGAPGVTGPTGAQGNAGPQGPQGNQGLQGPTGPNGQNGTDGNNGATGPSGQNGITGATGARGATGQNGLAGATGATGANGTNGNTGATGATGADGITGATGATGAKGATGTDGFNGLNGNNGATGATGPSGQDGANGFNGVTGATGATGADGVNGNNGFNGVTGATGTNGVTGATGATGTNGTNGATGATGATGTNGTNGSTGATGATGTSGTNGLNGATGATGATGTNGTNGATGATGATGTNGTNGSTGATGATGTNGTNGLNGITGVTGASGSNGANGATGATGATGTNGTNGATGATGTTGTNGSNGSNGTTGATGATGVTGTSGTNGLNGATGATGATGTNGTNGATGAIGATGTNGSTGATGATGTNGTNGATGATGPTATNGTNGATGATGLQGPTGAGGLNGTLNYVVKFTPDGVTGGNSIIYDNGTAVGIGTPTPSATLDVNGNGLLVTGSGTIPATGAGTRMMWYPGPAAFRAGGAAGTEWDDVNTGQYSTAFGLATTASGKYSSAMGNQATASGDYSLAVGRSDTASGQASTAMGASTSASGYFSTAMGSGSLASGRASTAMGSNTVASGDYSTATGNSTQALSFGETAMGEYNTSYSPSSSTSWNSTDRLFGIGNGISGSPKDALVVLKNGSTGIGTATPASFVEIRQDSTGNVGPHLSISNYTAGEGYGGTIDFLTFPLDFNGAKPSARIAVADDGNYSGSVIFSTNTPGSYGDELSERMRIADNGNVGINTSSPGALLTVNGTTQTNNFVMTDGAASGYLLQSDANGNASWVSPSAAGYWTLNNTYLCNNSGTNVGIGTTTPGNTLTVNGSGGIWNSNELNFYTDGGTTQRGFIGNYSSGSDFAIASTASSNWMRIGANNGSIAFFPDGTLASGNNPKVIFNVNGSAGFGTGNPASFFDIHQDSAGNMGPNLSISNYAAGPGYGGTIDFLTYPLFPSQGPSARIAVADDGDFSGSILFMTEAINSNGYNLTERMRVADNGNVGIGTSSPGSLLTVNGNTQTLMLYVSDSSVTSLFRMTTGASNGYIMQSDGNGNASWVSPSVAGYWTLNNTNLYNNSGTNVGIGTTAPTNALSVNAGINIDQDAANNGSLANNTSTGNGLTFGSAAGEGIASNRANSTAGSNQYGLDLYTDFTKRMSITNGGSIGIGTTSPASLFTVSGNDNSTNGKGAAIQISNTASGGANWYLRAGATGTGTPAGGLSIANDGAYVMDIDNTGNIGIGTSTPSTLLHVNGKLTISDGTQGNGKILMSDANGKASWTSNTKALNPSFKVQGNAGQSVGNNEEIQLNFNVIAWDDAGTMSLNNGYTVPISGTYHFDVRVLWGNGMAANAANTYIDCFVNGTAVDDQNTNLPINDSQAGKTSTYSGLVQLTAGDLVTFEIWQGNSSYNAQILYNTYGSETSWSGYKVN